MREEMSIRTAHECMLVVTDMRRRVGAFIGKPPDWDLVPSVAAACEVQGERIYHLRTLIRPKRLEYELSLLWEALLDDYTGKLTAAHARRDVDFLDDVARVIGDHLTNVSSELEFYLRADYERAWQRRLTPWKRYVFTTRPPFVRKATLRDHLEWVDREGLPKRDY